MEYEFPMAEIASKTTEEYIGLADGMERAAAVVVMDLRALEGIIILEVVVCLVEALMLSASPTEEYTTTIEGADWAV